MAAEACFIPEHVSFSLFSFSVIRQVGSERKRLSRHYLLVQVSSVLDFVMCFK